MQFQTIARQNHFSSVRRSPLFCACCPRNCVKCRFESKSNRRTKFCKVLFNLRRYGTSTALKDKPTTEEDEHTSISSIDDNEQDHLINHQNQNDTVRMSVAIINSNEDEEHSRAKIDQLLHENRELLERVEQLEIEKAQLESDAYKQQQAQRLILETFEGEGEEWCDTLEDGACPVEPEISFGQALRDRAIWLVGLLILQSFSGIILSRNELLISNHPFLVYFLTMLVGAGGNAGNQASVRVIRGLALGTLNEKTQSQFLLRELKMAMALSSLLTLTGFIRAAAFATPMPEAIAITAALFLIVFSSICLGAILPLGLKRIGIDPAHSSTSIQVIMDILGVLFAVGVSSLLLDSPLGSFLLSKLTGSSS